MFKLFGSLSSSSSLLPSPVEDSGFSIPGNRKLPHFGTEHLNAALKRSSILPDLYYPKISALSKPILRTRSAKCAAIVEIRRKSPRKSYSIHKKKPSLIVDALNNTAPGGSSVNARIAGLDLLNAFSGSFAERGSRRLDIIDIYVIILCYRLRCDLPRSRDSIFRVSYFVYRRLSSFVEYVFWDCSRGFE